MSIHKYHNKKKLQGGDGEVAGTNPYLAVAGGGLGAISSYMGASSKKKGLQASYDKLSPYVSGLGEQSDEFYDIMRDYLPGGKMGRAVRGDQISALAGTVQGLTPSQRRAGINQIFSKTLQSIPSTYAGLAQSAQGFGSLGKDLQFKEYEGGEALATLAGAKKSINPTAEALGSLGATAMSFAQDGGMIKGPHHAAGGVDAGDVEVQGGEYVVNATSASKYKSLLDMINGDNNEVTMMDEAFGNKHSKYQGGGFFQGGGGYIDDSKVPSYLTEEFRNSFGMGKFGGTGSGIQQSMLDSLVSAYSDRYNKQVSDVYEDALPLEEESTERKIEVIRAMKLADDYNLNKQAGGKVLFDTQLHARDITPTEWGGYDVKNLMSIPAEQVGGEGGRRWYSGKGTSRDMGFGSSKARLDAMNTMAFSEGDSLTTQQAQEMFPSYFGIEPEPEVEDKGGFLKRLFGKDKQGGGKLQSVNETTISKTLKRLFNK